MSSSTSSFKRTLFATLATLLILLGVALATLEWHLRRQVAQNVREEAYRRRVLHGVAPWVAVGDSHTANGLVTSEWLDNLGQPSDNLDSMLGKLAIRAQRPGLKGVILSADAQNFAFYRLTSDQSARVREFLNERPSLLLFLQPQYRKYLVNNVLAIASDPPVLWRTLGINIQPEEPREPSTLRWDKEAVLRAQLHTPIHGIRTSSTAMRYIKIVEDLMKQNIKVCLVTYPLSSAYRRVVATVPTFTEARDFYAMVATDTGARLIDASDIFPDRLFGDPDHLSPHGAAKLTAYLQRECEMEVGQ